MKNKRTSKIIDTKQDAEDITCAVAGPSQAIIERIESNYYLFFIDKKWLQFVSNWLTLQWYKGLVRDIPLSFDIRRIMTEYGSFTKDEKEDARIVFCTDLSFRSRNSS